MIGAVALYLGLSAASLVADPQVPVADDEIIVTGISEREKRVRNYVRELAPAAKDEALARFEDDVPLCIATIGLSPERNSAITSRMRKVASAAGLKIAGPRCRINIFVAIGSDKDAVLKTIRKERPNLLRNQARDSVDLSDQQGPVIAWQNLAYVDRDGKRIAYDATNGYYVTESNHTPSRINAVRRPVFNAAVVVMTSGALVGLTTTQIADYAIMRALTGADPKKIGNAGLPTILTIIDAPMNAELPMTLTPADMAFLKARYSVSPMMYAPYQRSEIGDAILRGEGSEE